MTSKSPSPHAPDGQPGILLVDDDPGIIQTLNKSLRDLGRIRFAANGEDALKLIAQETPDLILLDSEMDGMSGREVLRTIRSDHGLADIPVIFITGITDEAFEQECLEAGAADFITKPVRVAIVRARVKTQLRLRRMTEQLKQLATTDGLTGATNRRGFDAALHREWAVAVRNERALGLLLLDIDHFKKFNDHYGHLAGDECLIEFARGVQQVLRRPADLLCRYGGEEFAVVLPDTDAAGAVDVAHMVLRAIAALGIPHEKSSCAAHVTASIGCAAYEPHTRVSIDATDLKPADLVAAVDTALYHAKAAGRAQIAAGAPLGVPRLGAAERI